MYKARSKLEAKNRESIKLFNLIGRENEITKTKSIIDVAIECNESAIVAIVGKSGFGKSSICQAVQDLFSKKEGFLIWFEIIS